MINIFKLLLSIPLSIAYTRSIASGSYLGANDDSVKEPEKRIKRVVKMTNADQNYIRWVTENEDVRYDK